MNRPRVIDLRESGLPEAIGVCSGNLARLNQYVNEAQERLLHDPVAPEEGWWGGHARMQFTVTPNSPNIIAPREVARIISLTVANEAIPIRNGFYEFLQFGIGYQPNDNTDQLQTLERESVATLAPLVGSKYIRAYIWDNRDADKRVLVQGDDINGERVTTTDTNTYRAILGEYINLELPFETSLTVFSSITGIQKDITYGPITLTQVDTTTGSETALSAMEPGETVALYRKYRVNKLVNNNCTALPSSQVEAMVKLDFIPVASDSDYLLIQSIPALIEEVQAILKGRMHDVARQKEAEAHHARALRLLFGQIDHYEGKTSVSVRVPIFGCDRLKPSVR